MAKNAPPSRRITGTSWLDRLRSLRGPVEYGVKTPRDRIGFPIALNSCGGRGLGLGMLPCNGELHPNPPRLITVGIAVALLVIGAILALPIEPAVDLLAPLDGLLARVGLPLNQQTGFLALFLGNALLVVGSLVPGI